MSDVQKFLKSILAMAPMNEKKEVLKFAARCRDQDRQYEINNNAELDNGVYHKFVYSSKDDSRDKENIKVKGHAGDGREHLLSRNSSMLQAAGRAEKAELYLDTSEEDLTRAARKKTKG